MTQEAIKMFVIIRKSRITDFYDSTRVVGQNKLDALASCFNTGLFHEESSLHVRSTLFSNVDDGVDIYRTQLFDYVIIEQL